PPGPESRARNPISCFGCRAPAERVVSPRQRHRQARKERAMATYVVLFNWTDQGIKNFKDSPARVEAATEEMEKSGVRIKDIYWTLGSYDLVGVVEAADAESLTSVLLSLGAQGHARTTTLRAVVRDEFV